MAIGLEREVVTVSTEQAAGWCPPNAQDILIANIPDGNHWYENRLPMYRVISYTVDRYDDALQDARALKIFKAELHYCSKEGGVLTAEQIW